MSLQNTHVALLENTRFHPGEEANDKYFSQELGRLGNLFINDAFSASHRAHASTTGIARFLPTAAGRLMEKELSALESALLKPAHPVVAIVGGAKVSTKIEVLSNLIKPEKKMSMLFIKALEKDVTFVKFNSFLNKKEIKVRKCKLNFKFT